MDRNINKIELFKDYYFNNKGILYKSFEININDFHGSYDIYWGDPNIIFDDKSSKESFPLAVTTISNIVNYPKPRIFIHNKLEKEYKNVFEMIIAHEIGHLWLHDIVGLTQQKKCYMNEKVAEIWADYFSYKYFIKYRNIYKLNQFVEIFKEVSSFQLELYNLAPNIYMEYTFNQKVKKLKLLDENNISKLENDDQVIIQMENAIEITLNALGDIFD